LETRKSGRQGAEETKTKCARERANGKAYRVGVGLGLHGSQQRLQTRVEFERFDRHLEEVIDGADGGRHLGGGIEGRRE
jgi:hypothetical protein